jgi:hypothetical protein
MSDTPETDHLEVQLGQAAMHSHPILWEHSRRMERERDEAMKSLENLKASLDQIASLFESKAMTATVDQRIADAYDMRCIARQAIDQLKEGAK